jgi:hypothetical protein
MTRSAVHKIRPSKNLLSKRYDSSLHVDLLEQFTYFGLIRKFNLDFYCHAFGIDSPKSKGVSGMDVKNLYEAGKIKDIAYIVQKMCLQNTNSLKFGMNTLTLVDYLCLKMNQNTKAFSI